MGRGAILPPVNIAVLQPAAPAGTPQQSIAVIAIPLVHGASIRIRSIAEAKPAPAAARLPRGYLKTPNAPGQRAFLRCAASFFLEIRQYSCEKMSCATQKSLAAGHIMSFQIHPKEKQEDGSIGANSGTSKADAAGLSRADGLYGVFVWLQFSLPVLP